MTQRATTATTAEDWTCLFDAVKLHLLHTSGNAAAASPEGQLPSSFGNLACNCTQDCLAALDKLQALLAEERAHVRRLEQERSRLHRRPSTPHHAEPQATLHLIGDHHAAQ
jgi:hypothetical protein